MSRAERVPVEDGPVCICLPDRLDLGVCDIDCEVHGGGSAYGPSVEQAAALGLSEYEDAATQAAVTEIVDAAVEMARCANAMCRVSTFRVSVFTGARCPACYGQNEPEKRGEADE